MIALPTHSTALASDRKTIRACITVRGAVQGVGFRPFVYRLASRLGLNGWVNNSPAGVHIEAEGEACAIDELLKRIQSEAPEQAHINSLNTDFREAVGYSSFVIEKSAGGEKRATILPDLATCPDCLVELFDRANRRFLYPFTNCTHCGPRFSIIEALPYDRANTTMRHFPFCPECAREYADPDNRRFHAQPNACPVCGPELQVWDGDGKLQAGRDDAIQMVADALRLGSIVAVKGLGGFHLMADATNESAVRQLRQRKHRNENPFAIMAADITSAETLAHFDAIERHLLMSQAAPIVLCRARTEAHSNLAPSIAPGNPFLGIMLPYTPLHHLLMHELHTPLVATSGNLSDEPICIDEFEALERLNSIADLFLVHNRPIARPLDDSVLRVALGREMIIRRGRGYAPLPIALNGAGDALPVLATGAHYKNTIAVAIGDHAFLSQHIGDMDSPQANEAFHRVIDDFRCMYDVTPPVVACDAHPEYASTRYAESRPAQVVRVQHHYAHVLSCLVDNNMRPPVFGVAWDGTGLGDDGSIWGGEFLNITEDGYRRLGHLRTFPLPGGDIAAREPRRSAIGLLYGLFGEVVLDRRDLAPAMAFSENQVAVLLNMLRRELNCPMTSSAGRVFDAVASILGIRQQAEFEGQAAMDLQFAAEREQTRDVYPLSVTDGIVDLTDCIFAILEDHSHYVRVDRIARRFHNTLAEAIACSAERASAARVALTGGCFQNELLLEESVLRLRDRGMEPIWHRAIPPNDGGLAVGQIMAARMRLEH